MAGGATRADGIIDTIAGPPGGHTPGTRPIHAPGIGVTGRFQASDVASRYTDAAHFSGDPVPVTVRFSNGVSSMGVPDAEPLVRGMAVKFHLGDVTVDEHGVRHGSPDVDMVAMNLPVFFTRTVEDLMRFAAAIAPTPVPRVPWWRTVADALQLRPPPARPLRPGDLGAVAFADAYPPARRSVVALTGLSVPESYVTAAYHAVHAFVLTAGERSMAVRFRWEPVAGVRARAAAETRSVYLQDELRERLARGPADFVLRMQVAEQGDDTSDPTTPWPETRRRVVMGQLRIDAVVSDQVDGAERLTFDPCRLTPGIGVSDDPTLRARGDVYPRSFERRLAVPPR